MPKSGEYGDPALILAIRQEVEAAIAPMAKDVREIYQRLGRGDTAFALMEQRIDAMSAAAAPTDRTTRRREINPIVLIVITAAISGPVGAIASGLMQMGAAK